MVLFKSFKGCVFHTKLVSFHSRCREWGQRSDTVQQIKEPCLRVFPGFFRGPHREGESPPYAEKVRFRRTGIKKAHAVILCCCNNQTNGNSQLRVPWNFWWENPIALARRFSSLSGLSMWRIVFRPVWAPQEKQKQSWHFQILSRISLSARPDTSPVTLR